MKLSFFLILHLQKKIWNTCSSNNEWMILPLTIFPSWRNIWTIIFHTNELKRNKRHKCGCATFSQITKTKNRRCIVWKIEETLSESSRNGSQYFTYLKLLLPIFIFWNASICFRSITNLHFINNFIKVSFHKSK